MIALNIAIQVKQQGFGIYGETKTTRIHKIYTETIYGLEKELNTGNLKETAQIQQIFDKKYKFDIGYSFYVLDSSGNVCAGTNKGIQSVDKKVLIDGKREYSEFKTDKNIFKITGCDALKDGYYLYYVYLKYGQDDTGMLFFALIGSLMLFLCLIWGRISYITKIIATVDKIATGDLTQRAPIRYKNELRELAEGINFMVTELENEEQRKNEFMTNISHDIRTPLTTILGYVTMIQNKKFDSPEEMSRYLFIIERKGHFLESIIDDFFQYSKLASKDIVLNLEKLELNELARQVYEDEQNEFLEKRLSLDLELYKEPVMIYADPEWMIRAIHNLIQNALKYAKPDTKVKLKIAQEKINHVLYATFALSNIPKETICTTDLNLFFERMYKKDTSRSKDGSGLGLSIVKNIVSLHNGITTSSLKGDYVEFKLSFVLIVNKC